MGQKLMAFVDGLRGRRRQDLHDQAEGADRPRARGARQAVVDVPFMMPKRVAETDPNKQISTTSSARARSSSRRTSGSRARRRSTSRIRQVQAARRAALGPGRRQGRQGRPRRMASRIPDQQTAVNALIAGEIDYHRSAAARPAAAAAKAEPNIKLVDCNPLGNQYAFRFNTLHKPFDNAKIRQALLVRLQPGGLPRGGRSATRSTTRSARRCSSAARRCASDKGMEDMLEVELRQGARSS